MGLGFRVLGFGGLGVDQQEENQRSQDAGDQKPVVVREGERVDAVILLLCSREFWHSAVTLNPKPTVQDYKI